MTDHDREHAPAWQAVARELEVKVRLIDRELAELGACNGFLRQTLLRRRADLHGELRAARAGLRLVARPSPW